MIRVNDTHTEIFQLSDAQSVLNFQLHHPAWGCGPSHATTAVARTWRYQRSYDSIVLVRGSAYEMTVEYSLKSSRTASTPGILTSSKHRGHENKSCYLRLGIFVIGALRLTMVRYSQSLADLLKTTS